MCFLFQSLVNIEACLGNITIISDWIKCSSLKIHLWNKKTLCCLMYYEIIAKNWKKPKMLWTLTKKDVKKPLNYQKNPVATIYLQLVNKSSL